MEAGKLRTFVRIEQPTAVIGGLMGRTSSWATFATCYASIETSGGSERPFAKGTTGTTSHSIETRWLEGVTPKMRVAIYDEEDEYAVDPVEVYSITSAYDPDRRRRTLVISATKVL